MEKRLEALTQPLTDDGSIAFEDLFNLADIQRLQDEFARATGVASIITGTDGTPITAPSGFCRLCKDIIRETPEGRANCYRSDALLGRARPEGPVVQPCTSGGLWDAGAGISVGGRHLANWLIGQVRDETQTEDRMRAYAREIGANEHEVIAAFREVPGMSREQFGHVAQVLFTLANQLSTAAYQNIQQARFITERRRAEQEQRQLQGQLAQAQKMESIGRLAGGVAHDFNNMLAVILGHTELALDRLVSTDPLHADLMEIRKAAERSADLVRQLLAFARKQTVSPRVLDLNAVVDGMLKMLRRLIGEDVNLTWRPGTDLRPVKIDPSQLDQVLTNLCVNARDSIDGVGTITIETRNGDIDEAFCATHPGAVPGGYVTLDVADTGCGMSRDVLEHLFEPFYTTKGAGRGTGLGLATVYGIVKQNDGFVDVSSEEGQGTIFRIYVPAQADASAAMPAAGLSGEPERGYETVLLVEDEAAILSLGRIMLEKMGYTVLTAGTPAEAIEIARTFTGDIHLLITDVVMPEMNGRDLATRLLSFYPNIGRLFMSGYTANVIAHHGVLEDGVRFIQKPFSARALAAKVREALDQG